MKKTTVLMGGNATIGLMAALAIGMKSAGKSRRITPVRTPEQIAAADKRTERQRWNDAVDARKAAKKAGKP